MKGVDARMPSDALELTGGSPIRITDIGHSTMLIELAGMNILTDPWFAEPSFGIVARPRGIGMRVEELPALDLILISHDHFDHCDLEALSRMDKAVPVIAPDNKTAARIRKLGFVDATALSPWESRPKSKITVTALPGDHPVPECTYIAASGGQSVYFGGDTKYIKDFREIGDKFDIAVALLPISGVKLPVAGRVVMDPIEAAEAAVELKAPVAIPIHYNMSLRIPVLKGIFEKIAPGTPEQFAAEVDRRNRRIKVVTLKPGETWQGE